MMVLSRFWYLILALFAAAGFYALSLAVGQYNRRSELAMQDGLKADTQVVSWALQIDSRRRLDALLFAAVDDGVRKSLRAVVGKDSIAPAARDEGKKALLSAGERLPADYRFDALFIIDRDGRVVAASGYDDLAKAPEMELGGYPAAFDALHGYARDDTWVWGGKLARIAARAVEDEIGQAPIGAIIGVQWVDQKYATELAKRTHADLLFYVDANRVASGLHGDALDAPSLDSLSPELAKLATDVDYSKSGRSAVRASTDGRYSAVYAKLPGDAILLGAGFAVVRAKTEIAGPMGFLTGADDRDKGSVKLWIVGLIALLGIGVGLLLTYLEHSRPLGELRRQAAAVRVGPQTALALPRLAAAYRAIGADLNQAIERLLEQGGGVARKPADLEAILGPVPVQPQMSAFSFPQADAQAANFAPPGGVGAPGFPQVGPAAGFGAPQHMNPQQHPNAAAHQGGHMNAPIAPPAPKGPPPGMRLPGAPAAPPVAPNAPNPAPVPTNSGAASFAMPAAPIPAAGGTPVATGTGPLLPGVTARGAPAVVAPTLATPSFMGGGKAPSGENPGFDESDDEETRVGNAPSEVLAASQAGGAAASLGGLGSNETPAEWRQVFEEFVSTKRQCGESVEALTYDKFVVTLRKNRDALVARHNCSRVRFSVYVKDGRASLKATPVRD